MRRPLLGEQRRTTKRYAALCVTTGALRGGAPLVVDAPICKVAGVEHCERRCCGPGEEAAGLAARTSLQLVAVAEGGEGGEGGAGGAGAVLATPEHGRTHQVRLHCARAGAPLLADPLYPLAHAAPPAAAAPAVRPAGLLLARHALHAYSLRLPHPASGEELEIVAPLPDDMLTAARALRLRPLSEGRERGLDDAVQQLQAELLVT